MKITKSKGQNVESIFRMIRTSRVEKITASKVDHNVENHFVEKNIESQTFEVLIFLDTIGNIRTPKV